MNDIQRNSAATLPSAAAGFKTTVPIRGRYDNWIGGKYVAPVRASTSPTRRRSPASRSARWPAPRTRTSKRRSMLRTPPR